MRELLRRIRAWGRSTRETLRPVTDLFPFTLLGLLVLAASWWALDHYGLERLDLILLVVGAVGVGLVVVSLLASVIGAAVLWTSLRNRRSDKPLNLDCGFAARTGFRTPTLWYLPFINVTWTWLEPPARVKLVRRHGKFHEEITPTRRGVLKAIVRRFVIRDIFGLTEVAFRLREDRSIRFVPSVGALRQMHVVRSMAGGDLLSHPEGPSEGDPIDMRRYNPGDPIRFVLWKVFAKTRALLVRTPERAISPVRQTVAYLVASEGDEPAAGAARVAIDGGALGNQWVLGTDGQSDTAKDAKHALDLLARSARTTPAESGVGLLAFLDKAAPGSVGRAVVFVPGKPGPWLERVVKAARSRGPKANLEFIVCTDGIDHTPRRGRLARWALKSQPGSQPNAEAAPKRENGRVSAGEVSEVIRSLTGARSKIMLVDRAAGRVFSEGHLKNLQGA